MKFIYFFFILGRRFLSWQFQKGEFDKSQPQYSPEHYHYHYSKSYLNIFKEKID